MNICNIKRTFVELRPKRNWKTIYWLVDVHGVIIPGSWHKENDFHFIAPECEEVLKWISDREDQMLILWTSSYEKELMALYEWLKSKGIYVADFNMNPFEENTEYADFSKKPYFNILIDDKAGMTPECDWLLIGKEIENATEDKVIEWTDDKKARLKLAVDKISKELNELIIFPEIIQSP